MGSNMVHWHSKAVEIVFNPVQTDRSQDFSPIFEFLLVMATTCFFWTSFSLLPFVKQIVLEWFLDPAALALIRPGSGWWNETQSSQKYLVNHSQSTIFSLDVLSLSKWNHHLKLHIEVFRLSLPNNTKLFYASFVSFSESVFLIRWHPRPGSEEPGWIAADAVWMWGAEHGSPGPQHLHPPLPERHTAAHRSHHGKSY